jgi:hypothetical protein
MYDSLFNVFPETKYCQTRKRPPLDEENFDTWIEPVLIIDTRLLSIRKFVDGHPNLEPHVFICY